MKILVAIDGSPFSDAAVQEVAQKPWPPGSEVKIVSIVEPPVWAGLDLLPVQHYDGRFETALEDLARTIVAAAVKKVRQQQVGALDVKGEAIPGHAKDAILEEARSWGADLIVVGSHGYTGLKRFWLGSVSLAIASNAATSKWRTPPRAAPSSQASTKEM